MEREKNLIRLQPKVAQPDKQAGFLCDHSELYFLGI
jgi:hypothetical protein